MGTARRDLAGTATDALIFGGFTPSRTATTEEYDGTSWTTRPSLATLENLD